MRNRWGKDLAIAREANQEEETSEESWGQCGMEIGRGGETMSRREWRRKADTVQIDMDSRQNGLGRGGRGKRQTFLGGVADHRPELLNDRYQADWQTCGT